MSGHAGDNVDHLRKALRRLVRAGKLDVRRRQDGRLELRRPGIEGQEPAVLEEATRAWTCGVAEGSGFVSLARRLGLGLEDAMAPWVGDA